MKIYIAYPTLPMVPITCILSLNNAINFASKKHQITFAPIIGESLITRARNTCLRKFLETDCDIFMFIDSDIEVLQINTIEKLIEDLETVEFVGGLYSLKDESQRCSSVVTSTKHHVKDYLNECIWLSTGCWAMRRSVIETMIKNYPDHHYMSDYPEAGHKTYDFFGLMVVEDKNGNRKLLSEDWSFPVDPNTNVLCDKFVTKKIKDVNIGDIIMAFDEYVLDGNQKRKMRKAIVQDKIYKNLPKIKITTEDNREIITTAEHQWLIKRGWRSNSTRKIDTSQKGKCQPQKSYWERTDKLKVGDSLYSIVNNIESTNIYDYDYMIGYINGMFDGDGCITQHEKYMSKSMFLAVCDEEIIKRISEYFDILDIKYSIRKINKSKFKNHRDIIRLLVCGHADNEEKFLNILDGRNDMNKFYSHNEKFFSGYLGGIYDAEGGCDGLTITISQFEYQNVVEKIGHVIFLNGFELKYDGRRFRITGFNTCTDFFLKAQPAVERKMPLMGIKKGKGNISMPQKKVKIIKIESLEETGEMICITTSSNTFVANGIASHNCLRYTSIGGNIWADTRIILAHLGFKSYTLQTVKQEPISVPEPGFDVQ